MQQEKVDQEFAEKQANVQSAPDDIQKLKAWCSKPPYLDLSRNVKVSLSNLQFVSDLDSNKYSVMMITLYLIIFIEINLRRDHKAGQHDRVVEEGCPDMGSSRRKASCNLAQILECRRQLTQSWR